MRRLVTRLVVLRNREVRLVKAQRQVARSLRSRLLTADGFRTMRIVDLGVK